MAFGFDCEAGWYPLIEELIERLNKEFPNEEIKVLQVKEKYAGLRFYVSGGSEKSDKLIAFYEELSYHVCEQCGEFWTAKERVKGGWYKTLCDKCAKEFEWENIKE
jgi:formylmethanofuran dehydrogenase subunit E